MVARMDDEASAWVTRLGLHAGPDGVHSREYRVTWFGGRALVRVRYYLLTSRAPRIAARGGEDGLYFHHTGGPVRVVVGDAGERLGPPDAYQVSVAGGTASTLELAAGSWALISAAALPGVTPDCASGSRDRSIDVTAAGPWDMSQGPVTGASLIAGLGLRPHGEGGHFTERWRSAGEVATAGGPRSLGSTIYYLLSEGAAIGHFHRNRADITHLLHSGGPIVYSLISPDGEWQEIVMGRDAGQVLAFTCPGGHYKSSRLGVGVGHGLISEIVAPGFDYADHAMADDALFGRLFPRHRARWAGYVR